MSAGTISPHCNTFAYKSSGKLAIEPLCPFLSYEEITSLSMIACTFGHQVTNVLRNVKHWNPQLFHHQQWHETDLNIYKMIYYSYYALQKHELAHFKDHFSAGVHHESYCVLKLQHEY